MVHSVSEIENSKDSLVYDARQTPPRYISTSSSNQHTFSIQQQANLTQLARLTSEMEQQMESLPDSTGLQ